MLGGPRLPNRRKSISFPRSSIFPEFPGELVLIGASSTRCSYSLFLRHARLPICFHGADRHLVQAARRPCAHGISAALMREHMANINLYISSKLRIYPAREEDLESHPLIGPYGKADATSDSLILSKWNHWAPDATWATVLDELIVVRVSDLANWPVDPHQTEDLINATAVSIRPGFSYFWFEAQDKAWHQRELVDLPDGVTVFRAGEVVRIPSGNSSIAWMEDKEFPVGLAGMHQVPSWLFKDPGSGDTALSPSSLDEELLDKIDEIDNASQQAGEPPFFEPQEEDFSRRREMIPMDVRLLFPIPVAEFIAAVSSAIQVDPAMLALPVAVAMAACIGTSRSLRLNPTWVEPACLWAVTIAASGSNKSAPFRMAMAPLKDLNQELVAEYREKLAVFETEKRSCKGGGQDPALHEQANRLVRPPEHRLLVKDVTIEKLAEMLEQNPHGLCLASDELRAWFLSFTRYSGASSEPYFLEFYDGSPSTVDRVTKAPIVLDQPLLSIVGNCQPAIMAKLLTSDAWSSGLAPRFLPCYPPTPFAMYQAPPEDIPEIAAYRQLTRKVFKALVGSKGELKLSPDVEKYWVTDLNTRRRRIYKLPETSARRSQLSKLNSIQARWALIHHVFFEMSKSDGNCDKPVAHESMLAGILFADWFDQEAGRVLGLLTSTGQSVQDDFWVSCLLSFENGATPRELFQRYRSKLNNAEEAKMILEALASKKLVHRSSVPSGEKGGRPTVRFISLEHLS